MTSENYKSKSDIRVDTSEFLNDVYLTSVS